VSCAWRKTSISVNFGLSSITFFFSWLVLSWGRLLAKRTSLFVVNAYDDKPVNFGTTETSLTSFYISLSLFVAAMVATGFVSVFKQAAWLPNLLGIVGTLFLFYGCMTLIAETRLALRSVNYEMAFTLMLRQKYQERRNETAKSASG